MDHGSRPALGGTERKDEEDMIPSSRLGARRVVTQQSKIPLPAIKPNRFLAVIGLVALAALGWWGFGRMQAVLPAYIDTTKYQAVELTTNRAYYGKVTRMTDNEIILTDVFYIQSPTQTTGETTNKFELIKLGDEMAGSYDTILINRSQVVMVENLKDGGQVSVKINEFHTQAKH